MKKNNKRNNLSHIITSKYYCGCKKIFTSKQPATLDSASPPIEVSVGGGAIFHAGQYYEGLKAQPRIRTNRAKLFETPALKSQKKLTIIISDFCKITRQRRPGEEKEKQNAYFLNSWKKVLGPLRLVSDGISWRFDAQTGQKFLSNYEF